MGYRHYLYAIPKKQVAEIQACKTNEDWCNFAEKHGYKVDRNCRDDGSGCVFPYQIGSAIYELGKRSEIGFELESERPSLFTSEELKERYSDDGFALLTKDDFKAIIEDYRQKIVEWLQSLLSVDERSCFSDEPIKKQYQFETLQDKLDAWSGKYFGILPIDLDESRERITGDWSYEYAIFELVRAYKVFDWENNDLVLVGW